MDIEFRLVQVDGNIIDIHGMGTNSYDSQGTPLITRGTFQDITERRQADEQIQTQLKELKQWYEVTKNRENRVIELKQIIHELKREQGKPEKQADQDLKNLQTGEIDNE